MKFTHILALLACATAILGCNKHMEYDISEGIDKEITLFEEEISVPLGNAGPIAIQTFLKDGLAKLFGSSVDQYISIDSEGYLWFVSKENLLNETVYDVDTQITDKTSPYDWNPSGVSASPGGLASMLGMFGMKCVNQKIGIYAINPLSRNITLNSTARISCRNAEYKTTYTDSAPVKDLVLKRRNDTTLIASFDVPANHLESIGNVTLDDAHISLPDNITGKIHFAEANLFFKIFSDYKTNVAIGEKLTVEKIPISIKKLNLPLSDYRLHKCIVSFDVVSTLPIDVTIVKVEVLEEDVLAEEGEDGEEPEPVVNENIVVSPNVSIYGGSPDKPATSNVELELESLDGPLPDIKGIKITVSFKAAEGYANTILNANQGLSIKNATATIHGGITIPL